MNDQTSKEEVVKEACQDIADRIAREKNMVVFNLPEKTGRVEDNIASDKADVRAINSITANLSSTAKITVRRLGRKTNKPRPLLVTYDNVEEKSNVMRNLYKLSEAEEPLKSVSIRHDMSQTQREQEKRLQEEARAQNEQQQKEDPSYVVVVRGRPWERQVVKVKKKGNKKTKKQDNQEGGENLEIVEKEEEEVVVVATEGTTTTSSHQ